jgi:hypothetical protein
VASLVALSDSHGTMTVPASRALRAANGNNLSAAEAIGRSGSCRSGECEWYTQRTVVTGAATNCDIRHRTMGVACGAANPVDFSCTAGQAVPWCAPGSAPVQSPCGVFAGGANTTGMPHARDMVDLAGAPAETWTAGAAVRVGWSMVANHGGGYAWRLCPQSKEQNEACFQSNTLDFASAEHEILNAAGQVVTTFPAVVVNGSGVTHPPGSQWMRNPIPLEQGMIAPIPGLPTLFGRGPFPYTVVDRVQLPLTLAPGRYTLSWRWDAEQVKQVWSQCADVQIVGGAGVEKGAAAAAAVSLADVCIGDSVGLDVKECASWVALYDALDGASWVGHKNETAVAARTNPCGALSDWWKKTIICSSYRDYKHITEIYLMGIGAPGSRDVRGVLPPSIGGLQGLIALSIVNADVYGVIPAALGEIPTLSMVWFDHNPALGGALPLSMSQLKLSVLELHYSNFSGVLPPLDYLEIADCTLYNKRWPSMPTAGNNVFACPLPHGADSCGAVCR